MRRRFARLSVVFAATLLPWAAGMAQMPPPQVRQETPEEVASRVLWAMFKFPMASVRLDVTVGGSMLADYPSIPRTATVDLAYDKKSPQDLDAKMVATLKGTGGTYELTAVNKKAQSNVTLKRADGATLAYRFTGAAGEKRGRRRLFGNGPLAKRMRRRRSPPQPVEKRLVERLRDAKLEFVPPNVLKWSDDKDRQLARLEFDAATSLPTSLMATQPTGTASATVRFSGWKQGQPVDLSLPLAEDAYDEFSLRDVGDVLALLAGEPMDDGEEGEGQ